MAQDYPDFHSFLFPDVLHEKWQMCTGERIALTGVLARLKPKLALEIGVYWGGSLSLTAQFSGEVIAIDIDPEIENRFAVPDNVDLRIGSSVELIPSVLSEIKNEGKALEYVLIDADHSAEGVRRDIELLLAYEPLTPMVLLIHASGNTDCREGILSANWGSSPFVQYVDCDFVPGQVIEHTVVGNKGEVWGGLAIAYLTPQERTGELVVTQSARASIAAVHAFEQGRISADATDSE